MADPPETNNRLTQGAGLSGLRYRFGLLPELKAINFWDEPQKLCKGQVRGLPLPSLSEKSSSINNSSNLYVLIHYYVKNKIITYLKKPITFTMKYWVIELLGKIKQYTYPYNLY